MFCETESSRLSDWNTHWSQIPGAIQRDAGIPADWTVTTWLFIPEKFVGEATAKLQALTPRPGTTGAVPMPKITTLESLVPWNAARWADMEASKSPLAPSQTDD